MWMDKVFGVPFVLCHNNLYYLVVTPYVGQISNIETNLYLQFCFSLSWQQFGLGILFGFDVGFLHQLNMLMLLIFFIISLLLFAYLLFFCNQSCEWKSWQVLVMGLLLLMIVLLFQLCCKTSLMWHILCLHNSIYWVPFSS